MAARYPHCGGHPQRGVTLIDQIIVLVIVGVMLGVAAPPLHQVLARNEIRSAQIDFIGALQYARSTAITSGKQVVFCPSTDTRRCASTTRWDQGWIIGIDADHDNQPDDAPKYTGASRSGRLTIHSSVGRQVVRFHADGSASGSNLTVLFCPSHGTAAVLSVVVANSGRVRGAPASAEQAATCT